MKNHGSSAQDSRAARDRTRSNRETISRLLVLPFSPSFLIFPVSSQFRIVSADQRSVSYIRHAFQCETRVAQNPVWRYTRYHTRGSFMISSKYRQRCFASRKAQLDRGEQGSNCRGLTEGGGFRSRFFPSTFRPPDAGRSRTLGRNAGRWWRQRSGGSDTLRYAELKPSAALFPIPYQANRRITVEPSLAGPLSQGPRERWSLSLVRPHVIVTNVSTNRGAPLPQASELDGIRSGRKIGIESNARTPRNASPLRPILFSASSSFCLPCITCSPSFPPLSFPLPSARRVAWKSIVLLVVVDQVDHYPARFGT